MHTMNNIGKYLCLLMVAGVLILAMGIYVKITFDMPPNRNGGDMLELYTGVRLSPDREVYARDDNGFGSTVRFAFQASQREIDRIVSSQKFSLKGPCPVFVGVRYYWWTPPPKTAQHYRKENLTSWVELYYFPEGQEAYVIYSGF